MNKALLLLLAGDLSSGLIAGSIAHLMYNRALPLASENGAARIVIFASLLLLTSYLVELYAGDRLYRKGEMALRIGFSLLLALVILAAIGYLLPGPVFTPGMLASALGTFGLLQFFWHSNIHLLFKIPWLAQKVLIVGVGPVANQVERILASGAHNYILAGSVVPAGDGGGSDLSDSLSRLTSREKIDKIVISLTERRGVLPMREILGCKLTGIEVVDAMSFYEQMTGKLLVEKINPSWFIFSSNTKLTPFVRFYKRGLDVLFALFGILMAAPLFPLIALAIRLDSEGPVFFCQTRVGRGEKPFTLYKFRTMRRDAEEKTGAVWARPGDARITRVGRFLRKTRLDELPQLFNVLNGDMSMVGPRPERPEFVATLKEEIPYYSNRHCVKPGATGWAQVKYPYGASVEDAVEKLRYDLYYIKNYSLLLDLTIILETVKVVLFGRGAR